MGSTDLTGLLEVAVAEMGTVDVTTLLLTTVAGAEWRGQSAISDSAWTRTATPSAKPGAGSCNSRQNAADTGTARRRHA